MWYWVVKRITIFAYCEWQWKITINQDVAINSHNSKFTGHHVLARRFTHVNSLNTSSNPSLGLPTQHPVVPRRSDLSHDLNFEISAAVAVIDNCLSWAVPRLAARGRVMKYWVPGVHCPTGIINHSGIVCAAILSAFQNLPNLYLAWTIICASNAHF